VRHITHMGEMRNAYKILVRKPVWKSTWKTRHRWKENTGMDFRVIGWILWTGLIWLRIGTSDGHL